MWKVVSRNVKLYFQLFWFCDICKKDFDAPNILVQSWKKSFCVFLNWIRDCCVFWRKSLAKTISITTWNQRLKQWQTNILEFGELHHFNQQSVGGPFAKCKLRVRFLARSIRHWALWRLAARLCWHFFQNSEYQLHGFLMTALTLFYTAIWSMRFTRGGEIKMPPYLTPKLTVVGTPNQAYGLLFTKFFFLELGFKLMASLLRSHHHIFEKWRHFFNTAKKPPI